MFQHYESEQDRKKRELGKGHPPSGRQDRSDPQPWLERRRELGLPAQELDGLHSAEHDVAAVSRFGCAQLLRNLGQLDRAERSFRTRAFPTWR